MKEARKHMEAYIAANKGSTDPATKAQVADMEASLQIFDAMGIHKKRVEEKRQMVSEMGSFIVTVARLELHVGGGSFISATWVFHYPYRASSNLQKSSPMQGRNFEFSSKSKGREGNQVKMTMITYPNNDTLKS